jgi:hypothetical protein
MMSGSGGGGRQQKKLWFTLLFLGILAVIVNLRLVSVCSKATSSSSNAESAADNNYLSMLLPPPPSSSLRRTTTRAVYRQYDVESSYNATANNTQLLTESYPRVLCFFMVSQKSLADAMAVRYSIWGKRCAMFAIITNGLNEGQQGEEGEPQYLDNNTTILLDIQYIIQKELQIRNWHQSSHATEARHSGYITFPPPHQETKNHLSLKSFYTWIYLSRHYSSNYTTTTTTLEGSNTNIHNHIDYIMKVDPDTYMIMDNYLSYLQEYYTPTQHAYIGRVFKTEGNVNDPFVSGLSVTLSTATASLLVQESSILQYVHIDTPPNEYDDISRSGGKTNKQQQQQQQQQLSYECSAERFVFGGAADDHTLSRCLMSLGIYPAYTRDRSGKERFMHYSPIDHYPAIPSVSTSNVLIKYNENDNNNNMKQQHEEPEWYVKFSWTPYSSKQGCCSSNAIAFHYVTLDKQNRTLVWDKLFHTWHWKEN